MTRRMSPPAPTRTPRRRPRRCRPAAGRVLAVLAALAAALPATPAAAAGDPGIRHVFQIVLENKSYDETFGPGSPATYLNGTLVPQGQLLRQYYGTGHFSLDNYISMVSGQAPNADTQGDCQNYVDVVPGTPYDDPATAYDEGQVLGQGCLYPAGVLTLADQLTAAGSSWRGYMEDMGNTAGREQPTCGQPGLDATRRDMTQTATAADQYAARHNPFVYFHSVVDDQPSCQAHVRPLTELRADLADAATTAAWTFITPDLCHDGHDATCADSSERGGLAGEDEFLRQVVPAILASPAYADGGLLVITYDESEVASDAAACCNEPTGPNTPAPGQTGPGGGRTGTLLLSPAITPGTVNDTPYNHYSLLRSEENLLGVGSETTTGLGGGDGRGHLGYAAMPGLRSFGDDVFAATPAASVPDVALPALAGLAGAVVVAIVAAVGRRRRGVSRATA